MELSKLRSAPSLLDNLVPVPFEVEGETVDIVINIDAFCSEFWRNAAIRIKERYLKSVKSSPTAKRATAAKSKRRRKKVAASAEQSPAGTAKADDDEALAPELPIQPFELLALEDDTERAIYVDLLTTPGIEGQSPVLADWGMTEAGEAVKPTAALLMGLPTPAVRELWTFCRRQADTVKKQPTRPTNGSRTTSETIADGS